MIESKGQILNNIDENKPYCLLFYVTLNFLIINYILYVLIYYPGYVALKLTFPILKLGFNE